MYVFVLPVSGGGFPSQLAILQHLCESKLIPDLTLASSGGNVAAYVAAAANWKWPAIERISRELTHELFATPWTGVSSISFMVGYFKGDVYNKGNGVVNILSRYFTSETIGTHEIWTGTYNKNQQKARLFCNRSPHTTILDISYIDCELTQSMSPVFMDGNIKSIAQATIASASIPALVPAEIIDEEAYIDGGIACASPLIIMQEPILQYVQQNQTSLHLIYINSVDLSSSHLNPCHTILDTCRQATRDIVRSQTVIDRLAGYQIIRCHPGPIHRDDFLCTYDNLERIKQIQTQVQYSLLEIYPTEKEEIDLTNFDGENVIHAIRKSYNQCRCRFWWIGDSTSEIYFILEQCKKTPRTANYLKI